jgi:hypothetical protein
VGASDIHIDLISHHADCSSCASVSFLLSSTTPRTLISAICHSFPLRSPEKVYTSGHEIDASGEFRIRVCQPALLDSVKYLMVRCNKVRRDGV